MVMATMPTDSPAQLSAPPRSHPLRVMVVEDSQVIRDLLIWAISRDPRLMLAAAVRSGEEALRVLDEVRADVISMDIRLPGIDGFETTRRIMTQRATPIVVVAGNVSQSELKISMNALHAGALTVLEKPVGASDADFEAFATQFCTQLVIMSQVKVVTRREQFVSTPAAPHRNVRIPAPMTPRSCEMIGIVASTGGPNAVLEVLRGIGPDFERPVLLVQHITPAFSSAFVQWLDDVAPLDVVEAQEGDTPEAGRVYVAPPDRHLQVRNRHLHLDHGPPVLLQRPSGTVLLASMAQDLGPNAIGVVLTGMGADGASGLRALRDAGAFTIAEAESTAVVYGMPAAAVALDAACESLPLPQIGARLRNLVCC